MTEFSRNAIHPILWLGSTEGNSLSRIFEQQIAAKLNRQQNNNRAYIDTAKIRQHRPNSAKKWFMQAAQCLQDPAYKGLPRVNNLKGD